MRRVQSILLLAVLAIAFFPWAILDLCPNSSGHQTADNMHHGSCSKGMMAHDSKKASDDQENLHSGLSFKAPGCTTVAPAVDDFSPSQNFAAPTLQQFVVVAILFDLLSLQFTDSKAYGQAPDFLNKSGPPPAVNPLRGPPIV